VFLKKSKKNPKNQNSDDNNVKTIARQDGGDSNEGPKQ
jgi:hypothetical protein